MNRSLFYSSAVACELLRRLHVLVTVLFANDMFLRRSLTSMHRRPANHYPRFRGAERTLRKTEKSTKTQKQLSKDVGTFVSLDLFKHLFISIPAATENQIPRALMAQIKEPNVCDRF